MSLPVELRPAFAAALRAQIDPVLVAFLATRNDTEIAKWCNAASTFVVPLKVVPTDQIGRAINYIAFAAMTTANRGTLAAFRDLNPNTFDGSKSDIREMLAGDTAAGIFSGALGGQGAATRAALLAVMSRLATRAERFFATGIGTSQTPGTLVFDGQITVEDVGRSLNEF